MQGKPTICPKHPRARGHLEKVKHKYKGRTYEYYRFVHASKRGEKLKKCYMQKLYLEPSAPPQKLSNILDKSIEKSEDEIKQLRLKTGKLPLNVKNFAVFTNSLEFYHTALILMRQNQKLRLRFNDRDSQFALLVSKIYEIPQVIDYVDELLVGIIQQLNQFATKMKNINPIHNPEQFKSVISEFKKINNIGKEIKHVACILSVLAELYKTEVHMPDKVLAKLIRKYGKDEIMPRRISKILGQLVPQKHLQHLKYNWRKECDDIILHLYLDGHLKLSPISPKQLSKIIRSTPSNANVITGDIKSELKRFAENKKAVLEDADLPNGFKEYARTESPLDKMASVSLEIIEEWNSKYGREPTMEELVEELDKSGAMPSRAY